MTLLITIFAAIISTIVWYKNAPNDAMKISNLCFIYWGASLMWLSDAIFEYAALGAEFFTPPLESMINDTYLGLSVVALGLIIWLALLFIKDPQGIIRASLTNKN